MKTHWIKRCIGIAFAVIAGVFILGFAVMYLWNWLMPELFGLKLITYCQAFGILVLSKILFGGFRGRRGCGCGHRGHWRSRWKEKWEGMSEEEREKFRSRCGDWCAPEEKKS
ncbi:MAG: hypothetical protein ACHQHP_04375 [Bacteroidia bacterium]